MTTVTKKTTKKTVKSNTDFNHLENISKLDAIIQDNNKVIKAKQDENRELFKDIFRNFKTDFSAYYNKLTLENNLLSKKVVYKLFADKIDTKTLSLKTQNLYKTFCNYYTQNTLSLNFELLNNDSNLFISLMNNYKLHFIDKKVTKKINGKNITYTFEEILGKDELFNLKTFKAINSYDALKNFNSELISKFDIRFNQFIAKKTEESIISDYIAKLAKNGLEKKTSKKVATK